MAFKPENRFRSGTRNAISDSAFQFRLLFPNSVSEFESAVIGSFSTRLVG